MEIRIQRNYDPSLLRGKDQNLFVGRFLQPEFRYMSAIITQFAKQACCICGKSLVEKQTVGELFGAAQAAEVLQTSSARFAAANSSA